MAAISFYDAQLALFRNPNQVKELVRLPDILSLTFTLDKEADLDFWRRKVGGARVIHGDEPW